jgi:hypothetical protein
MTVVFNRVLTTLFDDRNTNWVVVRGYFHKPSLVKVLVFVIAVDRVSFSRAGWVVS